ncbi:hypothetical protein [Orenia marismortui]|uniref:hypothetical protein n=1 Tax=Orenia marismortui TaxID=46469 RepID=UPI0003729F28|nr:hypothetical protein [Orenia marismortui]
MVRGWIFITWSVVDLFGEWIWKLGCGLLLGLVGYRFIFEIMLDGLYILSIEDKEEDIKG